jgi:nitrogenase molybdenum-iron protein NifN
MRRNKSIAGSHLTPADFNEVTELVESFGLSVIILPDLSALDGSRQVFSPLAAGGTTAEELKAMADASFTIGLGMSMEPAAKLLNRKFGI